MSVADDGFVISDKTMAGPQKPGFSIKYKFKFCIKGDFGDKPLSDILSPAAGGLSAFAPCAALAN